MSFKWTKLVPILFILASCGSDDCQCVSHTDPLVISIADSFVERGYPRPCCPVTFCQWGINCPPQLTGCGMAHMSSSGCCIEIVIDNSMSRKGCRDLPRTIEHEMWHELGMVD